MRSFRADYHLHTPLCRHAIGDPADYVQAAKEAGLTEIGFADHNPMPAYFDDWRMAIEELPLYFEMVEKAGSLDFPVRLGCECDFISGNERWIEELAGKVPWDYLIGSVHYIAPGWDVDNPKYIARFDEHSAEAVWDLYWKNYLRCIESGLFDFVAHPDLPKKFGHRPGGGLRRYYEPVIEALKRHDIAYEMNTAGLRKAAGEIYPAFQFVELAQQAGVPMLINSDAHAPEEVGSGFDAARELAKQAGYTKVSRFEARRRFEVDL